MSVYGYSVGAPAVGATIPTTAETVAGQAATLTAIIDRLMWLRRRLASVTDNAVEPDDIRTEDAIRNTERTA